MTEQEFKELADKVGNEVAAKLKAHSDDLQQKLNAFETKVTNDKVNAQEVKELKEQITAKSEEFNTVLKEQGIVIADLRSKISNTDVTEKSVLEVLKEKSADIDKIYRQKTGQVEIRLGYQADKNGNYKLVAKAADVHNTATVGANASITSTGISAVSLLRLASESASIETQQRSRPWILDFVSVGSTTSSALVWFDEVPKQGSFAITAEGAVKPLVMYTFNRKSSDYKKVAGRAKITEEFNNDFPRLVSTIMDLMKTDCRNAMNDAVLTNMIASATAYSNAGLALQIDNADDWAAIAAVAGQLANSYYTPNVLVLNPNRGIIAATAKDSTGQYINYQPVMDEIKSGNLQVIKHPSVAIGNFFLGDGSVYKVFLKGDVIVRIGYSNDDFDRNQYSLVVEQYYYDYVSDARKAGLVYAGFTAVKAAIEKP